MFETLYSLPFLVLEVPNLRIKQPSWIHQPSAMTIFSLVLLSYFLVTGGMYTFGIVLILVFLFDQLNFMKFVWFRRHNLRCNCWTTVSWIDHRWAWAFTTGGIHAVQNQWSIHYGRVGQQLPLYGRRPRIHHHGSDTCTGRTKTKSNPIDRDGLYFYSRLIFHHMAFYAHEIAGIFAAVEI